MMLSGFEYCDPRQDSWFDLSRNEDVVHESCGLENCGCCHSMYHEESLTMGTREEMQMMENYSRRSTVSERWNLMYSEQNRSPIYSVQHYITYLRKHVAETGYARTAGTTTSVPTVGPRPKPKPRALKPKGITKDSINPLSYFLRKLKLDLKMAYVEFVSDFVKAPNNGLRLLLSLLKNLQVLSSKNIGTVSRSEGKGTLKMDDYKRSMVDEQDCLLCIKYTLRVLNSTDELLEDNSGLLTVTTCLLSNFSKSRVTALEILTLIISGPSSVDKVLEAFTSIRLQYAESTRFKMLTSMMQMKGPSHVLFQVSCLRLLNNLLNMCQSSNMRVFLQYELEEAGLNLETVQMNADGDGLEFDDLRKEVREWKTRFIDVDCLLRKVKSDIKKEIRSDGLSEFYFDQKYGNKINHALSLNDLSWVTYHEHGCLIDYDRWLQYIETRQKMGHDTSMEEPGDRFLRRDVYIPDCHHPNKTLSNQSQLTDNKIKSPVRVPPGKFKYGHHHHHHHHHDVSSAYDVISANTSFCGSENTIENFNRKEQEDAERDKHKGRGSREYLNDETTPSAFKRPEQKTTSALINGSSDENWILKSAAETRERSKSLGDLSNKTMPLAYEGTQEMIERYDSGVSVNYGDQDYHIYSGKTPSIQPKPDSYKHIFYTGHDNGKDPYIDFQDTKPKTSMMPPTNFNSHDTRAFQNANNQVYNVQMQSLPVHQNNAKNEPFIKQNYISPVDSGYKNEKNAIHHGYGPNNARNFRPIVPSSRKKARTPSPDYIIDGSFKPLPLKTSTTRSNAYVRKPISHPSSNQKPVMENRNTPLTSSSLSNSGNLSGRPNHNNLSPKRTAPSALKQNGFNHYNKNSPGSNVAMKQAFFEDKVILNVKPTEDYVKEVKQPASLKRLNGNLVNDIGKDSPNVSTENALNAKKGAPNGKQGGEEVYSSEVNEILMGLDKTLEQHGWKDSIRVAHTTKVPFEAYI